METKTLTWTEVLESSHNEVIVESYGYMERGLLTYHFEPFKHKCEFVFRIDRDCLNELSSLTHSWLMLEGNESEQTFIEKEGKLYLDDPDLWARPYY